MACARMKRIGIEINLNIAKVAKENLSHNTLDEEVNEWLKKAKGHRR